MAVISRVPDLHNDNPVPEKEVIDFSFEKTKVMAHLMCELNKGRRSGEKEGYVSSDDVRAYFHRK